MWNRISRRRFLAIGALGVAGHSNLLTCNLWAQTVGKKYAVIVGVADYDPEELNPLRFPLHDAEALASELVKLQFDVSLMTAKATRPQMKPSSPQKILNVLQSRANVLSEDDTLVFAFMGHGVQFSADRLPGVEEVQELYFCPEDAVLNDRTTLLSMDLVQRTLSASKAGRKLLLVDACRNDPQPKGKSRSKDVELEPVGRAVRSLPRGMLAVFSCSIGETSREYPDLNSQTTQGHGVFTYHILKYLRGHAEPKSYPGGQLTMNDLVHYVSRETKDYVWNRDNKNQVPVLYGKLVPWSLGRAPTDELGQTDKIDLLLATCEGTSLAVSQDGTRVLTVSSSNDNPQGNFRVWDAAKGQLLHAWSAPESHAIINHNGTVALNADTFELRDLNSGKTQVIDRLSLNSNKTWSIAPDFSKLIVENEIYETGSDVKLASFEFPSGQAVRKILWREDGSAFLVRDSDGNWGVFSSPAGKTLSKGKSESGYACEVSGSLRYLAVDTQRDSPAAAMKIEVIDTQNAGNSFRVSRSGKIKFGTLLGVRLQEHAQGLRVLETANENWNDCRTQAAIAKRNAKATQGRVHGNNLYQFEMGLARCSLPSTSLDWARPCFADLSDLRLTKDGLRIAVGESSAGCSIEGMYCMGGGNIAAHALIEQGQRLLLPPSGLRVDSISIDNRTRLCWSSSKDMNDYVSPEDRDYCIERNDQRGTNFRTKNMPQISKNGEVLFSVEYGSGEGNIALYRFVELSPTDFSVTRTTSEWTGPVVSVSDNAEWVLTGDLQKYNPTNATEPKAILWRRCTKAAEFPGRLSGGVSPDGKYAVFFGQGREPVTLFDLENLREVRNVRCGLTNLDSCIFSRSNRLVAMCQTGSESSRIEILNVATGQPLLQIPNSTSMIEFSADEKWLVTLDAKRLRWWNLDTGKAELQIQYLNGGKDWICTAADNRFDATPAAKDLIVWQRKGTTAVFSSADLQSRLYVPRLMEMVLGKA